MRVRVLLLLVAVIGAVIALPAREPVAAVTASQWWVALAFANRELGAVVEGSGVEQAARCELSLYSTSNGGVTWATPVVLSHGASCGAGGSTDEMAMTADGSWFLATAQGLFRGRARHAGFELIRPDRLVPSEPTYTFCSVAAAGRSVWVVLADACGLRSAGVVLASGNDGAAWTRSRDMPLKSLDEANLIDATPPETLAVAGPASAWLIGSRTAPSSQGAAGTLAVTYTADAGRTWHASTLPCRTDAIAGMLTAVGNDVATLCLGDPSTGFAPMEVITSTNGGASWTERCDNGPLGLLRIVGACPGFGYPGAMVAMPDGALVMAIGYPIGGVDVSLDGGRTWKLVLRSAATFLSLSRGTGTVWVLALGPGSPGLRLAESTDGRRWHAVALPTLG
ncbi:MAG: hypothetical protein ABSF89_06665 [Acidimicrobiales bacterium]